MAKKQIALISTGGTIEKTYDAMSGLLANSVSVLDIMLDQMHLHGVELHRVGLMNKDSVQMSEADHVLIADTAAHHAQTHDGVVVVHGTDRLSISGELTATRKPLGPVVFTGAMRPRALRSTDADQNLTEALLAVQLLPAGVYLAMHNQVLSFPGVIKDREGGCFRMSDDATGPA